MKLLCFQMKIKSMFLKNIKPLAILLIVSFFLSSCNSSPNLDALPFLNGYWEIASVETDKGKEIEYKFNETVDYFELTAKNGVRTKVKPKLDGTFIKTNDAEGFTAKMQDDKLTLIYKTTWDTWSETILYLNDSKLVTQNDQGIRYTYNRFKGYLDNVETN